MIAEQIDITPAANWSQKLKDYSELVKLRLNLLVVFSSAISYAMAAAGNINWLQLGMLSLGGFLVKRGCASERGNVGGDRPAWRVSVSDSLRWRYIHPVLGQTKGLVAQCQLVSASHHRHPPVTPSSQ